MMIQHSATICLQWTCNDLHRSQLRKLLKLNWDPMRRAAICRRTWNVASCEHNRATVSGSQQTVKSRDQARRSSQDCRSLNLEWMPRSTMKNRALLRPRLSPPETSGSRRLARAVPRQAVGCVHAGNERAVSSGGSKPPLLSRTRQHDKRARIRPRASWRSQRARWPGLAATRSEPALKCDGRWLWRSHR